jgi:CubicO group peptidase (beta-lactamase class C family)
MGRLQRTVFFPRLPQMKLLATVLASLAFLLTPALSQEPTATPESLEKLDQLVQSLVEREQVVGAELLVIQHGKTLLHRSHGWSDREAKVPMSNGSVFCVRSMTKPLIGTAILMLADEGLLKLDDPVHKYLPYFDVDPTRKITIRHLLNHNSGFPMSLIMAMDLSELKSIEDVAILGAGRELDFEPGTNFRYSDQGTDTLTAVIEVVAKQPAAAFVEARILQPLGMESSTTFLTDDHPLRKRGGSKYVGGPGNWSPFWDTSKPSIFPFFLGSQGLYSTTEDYARFTKFWLNNGRVGDQQLLDPKRMAWALTPGPHPMGGRSGLPDMRSEYGSLMMVWTSTKDADGSTQSSASAEPSPSSTGPAQSKLTAFGHNGSDGTHAWAFPEQNAMAFYFTQSRGTMTGFQVEEALGEVFFGVEAATAQQAPPLEQFTGYYQENDDDSYRAIVLDGDGLALEVPGKGVVALDYVGEDRWRALTEGMVLEFQRSEQGEVISYSIGDHQEFKFQPAADLPSPEDVAVMVDKAHQMSQLEELGPLKVKTDIVFTRTGMSGTIETTYQWPDKVRIDAVIGPEFEHASFDGSKSWYHSKAKPLAARDGLIGEQIRKDHHLARFSNLLQWHPKLHVVQQLKRGSKDLLLVRTNDASAPARTIFVDANSGRVLGEDNVPTLEGLGRMGQRLRFNDFREVEGVLIPYELQIRFSNKMIGTIKATVTEVEFGGELADGFFELQG